MLDKILKLIGEAIELEKTRIVCGANDPGIEDANPWIPINGLIEIPDEFEDGRDVEVTCHDNRRVRVVGLRGASWLYSGTSTHFNGGDSVTAYRIPKPYGGE